MTAREALNDAVSSALQDMAFLDCATVAGAGGPTATSHIVVAGFTRPVRGRIALYLSLGCKHAIAENVFGRDWRTLSASEIDDCLLELGNVIAGSFLTAYTGTAGPHDVSLPEIHFDDAGLDPGGERVLECYDAEGHRLSALACLET